MFVYVQALDFGRLLRIQVEQNELVRSLKAKIDYELGGNQPEEIIDSLNYLGITLDCSTPLSTYGIRDSSLLYMGRSLIYPKPGAAAPVPVSAVPPPVVQQQQQQPIPVAHPVNPLYQQQAQYLAQQQYPAQQVYQQQVPQIAPVGSQPMVNYQQNSQQFW